MHFDHRLAGSVFVLGGIGLLAAGPSAKSRQDIVTLVLDGDYITDIGAVTSIDNIAVNSSGQWLVEADTNHANSDADGVLLRCLAASEMHFLSELEYLKRGPSRLAKGITSPVFGFRAGRGFLTLV